MTICLLKKKEYPELKRIPREAINVCIAYTNCDNRSVLKIQILPQVLKLRFFFLHSIVLLLAQLCAIFDSSFL